MDMIHQFSDDDQITYIPIYEASSEQSNPLIADIQCNEA